MATASQGTKLSFESKLWRATNALRSNLNAAEYRHVVLGLIFLKYISTAFEERHQNHFLTQFASADGKNGGQFYTPRCVVRVLVEMLAPYNGRVCDSCCGSAAFVRPLIINAV